jgi:hypothetical protein
MTSIPSTPRPRQIGGALAVAATCALIGASSAQAAAATSAVCTPRISVAIDPGFRVRPGSGTLTSHGETGSIVCTGRIGGHRVTGAGTVGLDETYVRGDCLAHVGTGTVRISVPTTAGIKHLTGAATSRRTALGLRAEARFPGARFTGVGVAIPTKGDCVLTPLRQALIAVTGRLRGDWMT